ncbi:hypothetical protein [Streptomyces sp. NPDC004014]
MSSVSRTRGTAVAVQVLSTIVLAAGLTAAPQALTAGHPASAADATCTTFSVPTYVFEPAASSNIAGKRTLHKYMEWGPKSTDTDLLDTQYTANLPATSKVFTGGGNGLIYEATTGGQVKSYKDNTATGGSLLTPVKTYSLNWSSAKWILTNGARILVIGSDGTLDVYNQASPATGDGAITKVMDGGSVGKIGKDVSYKDGSRNYGRAPKSYHAKVDNGTYFQLTRKKSTKFGTAVTFMGVGLGVTTSYDSDHKQKITAGTRRNATHLIWGKNGPVHDTPGVFYSS